MKLLLDPTRCQGHGACAELLGEYIRLDKWNYPIVLRDRIDARHLDLARRAVQLCPELALKLVEG